MDISTFMLVQVIKVTQKVFLVIGSVILSKVKGPDLTVIAIQIAHLSYGNVLIIARPCPTTID